MIKTALILAALLTRHVPPERVVIVLLGHALDVRPPHVAVALALTRGRLLETFLTACWRLEQVEHPTDIII
jgi:hypothetical protein